jgi:solute carrier family 30 (zinc transporter), member 9
MVVNSTNFYYFMQNSGKDGDIPGFVPVAAALFGNAFITIIKFIGFLMSGSSTMFSEAVHSFADTANQSLLIVGLKRSVKKSDKEFDYGYGKERFVWALISACGIFFVGAGVTLFHGINSLLHQEFVHINYFVYLILSVSFLIESFTFFLAYKELKQEGKKIGWQDIAGGDPSTLAVLYEDGVAVLGVLIAAVCIILSVVTGWVYWDGIGSMVIGALLGFIAIVLIDKNRSYLITKAIPDEVKERILEILEADSAVEKVHDFKSAVINVNCYRIKCEIEINGSALIKELDSNNFLKNEYEEIRNDYSEFIKFCVEYSDRVPRILGQKINEIEKKIQREVPEAIHIDIEVN